MHITYRVYLMFQIFHSSACLLHLRSFLCRQPTVKPQKPGLQCRETQTLQLKNSRAQSKREACTQMTKIGVYVTDTTDKTIMSRDVPTVDQWLDQKVRKIVTLQSYWRRWLAQRRVRAVRTEKAERERRERELQESLLHEKENLMSEELRRRTHPRSKADFDLVYKTIENWRQQELYKINIALDGPERKAMLCKVLKDEVALLLAVEAHRTRARSENEDFRKDQLLKNVSNPIAFKAAKNGQVTTMETPWITRAKELVALYKALTSSTFSKAERLDLLLSVTVTVSEFVCDLTAEISTLVDREVTMLTSGVKTTDHVLDGIRARTANLFLEFIKNPLFNPQVARFLPAQSSASGEPRIITNMQHCSACHAHKPADQFHPKSIAKNSALVCRDCERTRNIGQKREDLGFYRRALKALITTELTLTTELDPILRTITEHDFKLLFDSIWRKASLVSGRRDIYDLKFVRWNMKELWTPWNCVLLTREEAVVHVQMPNQQVYSEALTKKVAYKHNIAKSRFEPLLHAAKAQAPVRREMKKTPPGS